MDDALIDQLQDGQLHRFADFATLADVIPSSGAGVYTIWDDSGGLVYAGIAGRNPAGKGLASRLRSHANGRRSGDQFCVYVADHYVLPELSREQIEDIRDSRLSMDALVREKVRTAFGFRFAVVDDYRSAIQVENAIMSGKLRAGQPRLNPSPRSERADGPSSSGQRRDDGKGITVNAQDRRLITITTAPQLADYLKVNEKTLRGWLRKDFPNQAPGQGDEWRLTPEMNRKMAERAGHI